MDGGVLVIASLSVGNIKEGKKKKRKTNIRSISEDIDINKGCQGCLLIIKALLFIIKT